MTDSPVPASQSGKAQSLVAVNREIHLIPGTRRECRNRAIIEMDIPFFAEHYPNVTMPAPVEHEPGTIHRESSRIWNSYSERHTLFWTNSVRDEERLLRFARIGSLLSVILLTLLGTSELLFLGLLLWQVLR